MASTTRRIGEAVRADHRRAAGQHAQHDVGVVFARRQVEQQRRAQAEGRVHRARAGLVAAFGQAAEAQPAGAVDHQRAGQFARMRLRDRSISA